MFYIFRMECYSFPIFITVRLYYIIDAPKERIILQHFLMTYLELIKTQQAGFLTNLPGYRTDGIKRLFTSRCLYLWLI